MPAHDSRRATPWPTEPAAGGDLSAFVPNTRSFGPDDAPASGAVAAGSARPSVASGRVGSASRWPVAPLYAVTVSEPSPPQLQGQCDVAFAAVEAAFRENFISRGEVGVRRLYTATIQVNYFKMMSIISRRV